MSPRIELGSRLNGSQQFALAAYPNTMAVVIKHRSRKANIKLNAPVTHG
jgi:hypothetical protein